jgi:hypothetical protein
VLFNVNISPAGPSAPNFNVQVEAPDLIAALEAAKAPILKSANESAAIITAALPSAKPSEPKPTNQA